MSNSYGIQDLSGHGLYLGLGFRSEQVFFIGPKPFDTTNQSEYFQGI